VGILRATNKYFYIPYTLLSYLYREVYAKKRKLLFVLPANMNCYNEITAFKR